MTHSVLSSLSLSSSSLLTPSQSPCPIGSGNCDMHSCVGSSHHRQAQRLNNKAALCIEMGGRQQYQKAISILAKALRLSGEEPEQDEVVCTCHYCSIDGCIVSNDDDYNGNTTEMNEDNSDGSTIDENPIYVYEGHNMGSTLTYIIAFNLAIAHHLTAMEMANDAEKHDIVKQERIVNKALQFYELAYECNLTNTCSMRFDMIICNNLSHIYRHQEQQQTAQHVVVEPQDEPQTQVQLPQETPQAQSQSPSQAIIIDEDDEIDDDSDISFEYYSQQEEEEEYTHNSTLVSLLTTRSTISSSYTSSTTPSSTNNDLSQNGVSSHHYSTSPLLTFDHQKEAGNMEFCVTSTPERDSSSVRSIRSMYTTYIV